MIWSRHTGQRITWFNRCKLIITWCHLSTKHTINQGCMSLSIYYLEHGRHVAQLHRHGRLRRRRRARPRAIPLAMITMRKSINGFPLLSMGMGLRLAAFGHRSSATSKILGCYNDHWIYLTVDIIKSVWLIACPCILTGTSSWLLMQESCKTAAWWDHCTSTYSNEAYFTDMHFLTQEQHSEKCILKESNQSFTNTNQISLALIKFDLDKEQ